MPNNYFDHLVKKVGNIEELFYCKDTDARNAIILLENAISGIENELDGLWNVGESPVLYVSKTNSRFTTVNDAIDYAETYCSTTNRVTIVISSGLYQEYIDLDDNPGIDFFGIGNVVIRSNVAWRLSAIRCSNSIWVKGIRFENYYTPGDDEHAGYGLHADPVTGIQSYIDCDFYSDNNFGIGVGMGNNGQCNFYGCTMHGKSGGIYAHNNATNGTYGQWLRFYNCRSISIDGGECIRIDDAATMAQAGRISQMGLVFRNCIGNNHGVLYRYDNPQQTLSYIPTSSSYNVFLYEGEGNDFAGLNKIKQTPSLEYIFPSNGTNDKYLIPYPEAYKYTWSITSLEYKDYGSGWPANWSNVANKTITIQESTPDFISVTIPGTNTLPYGYRAFKLILTAVPRTNYTFPETIT